MEVLFPLFPPIFILRDAKQGQLRPILHINIACLAPRRVTVVLSMPRHGSVTARYTNLLQAMCEKNTEGKKKNPRDDVHRKTTQLSNSN